MEEDKERASGLLPIHGEVIGNGSQASQERFSQRPGVKIVATTTVLFAFADFFISQFFQMRGYVSVIASRVCLTGAALSFLAFCWIISLKVRRWRKTLIVSETLLVLAAAYYLDKITLPTPKVISQLENRQPVAPLSSTAPSQLPPKSVIASSRPRQSSGAATPRESDSVANETAQHLRSANPVQTVLPSVEQPQPSPGIGEDPYDELKRVGESITSLSNACASQALWRSQQFVAPYRQDLLHQKPMPQSLTEDQAESLQDGEHEYVGRYQSEVPLIERAHNNAIAKMNLTINAKNRDLQEFQEANSDALRFTRFHDLQSSTSPTCNRFFRMDSYIKGLLQKLGDYE